MKNIFKCSMIIIGTLIGAGFASGKEILTFFIRFLDFGLWGLIFSAILFGVIIFLIMTLINKYEVKEYEKLVKNRFLLIIMKAFTFICFCIMIAAIGSFGEEQYNISFWFGAIFAGIICFISFLFKFNGLEKINNFLVPFILFGVILLKLANNIECEFIGNVKDTYYFTNNWFISAVLYSGYNSILLIPILVELKNYKLKKNDILLLSIFVSMILCITGFLIFKVIDVYYPDILLAELPTLAIAKACNNFIWVYYSAVILFAIFTTAFSCGYSFLKINLDKNYFRNACLLCIFGVIFSKIGFSDLINICFPIFGYLGILQIVMIFLLFRKENINE